jgi:hypothetical protein
VLCTRARRKHLRLPAAKTMSAMKPTHNIGNGQIFHVSILPCRLALQQGAYHF